jgi:hypothetical protein
MKTILSILTGILLTFQAIAQNPTYAEKLGYPKGAKVIIMHVDDVGMSYDSNIGAIKAIEEGVANSLSVMMPCPWVPGFVHYLKNHPKTDAGLHLTLTSEWKDYRWGPLAGKANVPNLVDEEGAMYRVQPHMPLPTILKRKSEASWTEPAQWDLSQRTWTHTWEPYLPEPIIWKDT